MYPGSAAVAGVGGMAGLYAVMKFFKRLLGFKSCKYHSQSNNNECIFGCRATKRAQKENIPDIEPIPPSLIRSDNEIVVSDSEESKNEENITI